MHPSENHLEENRCLRRALRDLVALSTLPAVWVGLAPTGSPGSLADVLLDTLRLDLVYVRLAGSASEGMIDRCLTSPIRRPGDSGASTRIKAGFSRTFATGRYTDRSLSWN
jgi:hypothetical protein